MSNNAKRNILIVSIIIVSVTTAILVYYYFTNKQNTLSDEMDIVEHQDSRDILDVTPSPTKTPILYDFVHSTIGYKSDINAKSFGNSFAVLVRNDILNDDDVKRGTAHILRIFPQDFLPPIATGHVSIRFSEIGWRNAKSAFRDWPEDTKFEEGDYTLFIIKEVFDKNEKNRFTYMFNGEGLEWNGIDLMSLDYPEGWLTENLDKGWATEWIRKEPYKSAIWDFYKIDVNHEFFDKFKLHEVIEVESLTDEARYDTRKVRVVNVDTFNTVDPPVWQGMSLQQLNAQLKEEGYEQIHR